MKGQWFDDESIVEQEISEIRLASGEDVVGVVLEVVAGYNSTEIILDYAQLKAVLLDMEENYEEYTK